MNRVLRWGLLAVVVSAGVIVAMMQARDPVQEQWEDRVALPVCGSVVLDPGESLRHDAPSELACLREGLASGKGAELKIQWPTVEGDPIYTYHRVTPNGGVEAYEDSTEDGWGSGEWSFSACATPDSVMDSTC